jgi:hypothetical protein
VGFLCRLCIAVLFCTAFFCTHAWCQSEAWGTGLQANLNPGLSLQPHPFYESAQNNSDFLFVPPATLKDYLVKLAYGRTFGTSTQLDYATFELSKRVSSFPALTYWGPAVGEVQLALMASYVLYYEGNIEKVKNLDFRDGFELAWLPKGRFTFPVWFGLNPYLESGAGLSYVSETYRNSGSRWNWSFLGGFGFEKNVCDSGVFSLGVQWRHLSNGNMWGIGDELHNSNSGTDMVQGMATFIQRF